MSSVQNAPYKSMTLNSCRFLQIADRNRVSPAVDPSVRDAICIRDRRDIPALSNAPKSGYLLPANIISSQSETMRSDIARADAYRKHGMQTSLRQARAIRNSISSLLPLPSFSLPRRSEWHSDQPESAAADECNDKHVTSNEYSSVFREDPFSRFLSLRACVRKVCMN